MAHSTPSSFGLQSLLLSKDDFSSCFFRNPTERELEFLSFYQAVQSLLTSDEARQLSRHHIKGRVGYDPLCILGINLLKLHYRLETVKDTLLLLQENENLRMILDMPKVPSPASASRLYGVVEKIVHPSILHERFMLRYHEGMDGRVVGHLSIDSTIIEAREKPFSKEKAPPVEKKKKGRKKNGSEEQREYLERKADEERMKAEYLVQSPEESLSELEMRCSITAKQNSKGKKQWFIGYKAHLATDDFGVVVAYAVTGACVHDSKVAVPLMKLTGRRTDFLYALMDKGYLNPDIDAYADSIGRRVIIDQRAHRGVPAVPMDMATAQRYKSRTTVERTNGELKDGFLPDKIYRRGSHARYDIELAVLLTTMKKAWTVLLRKEEAKAKRAS
jgi:hypothetical protein